MALAITHIHQRLWDTCAPRPYSTIPISRLMELMRQFWSGLSDQNKALVDAELESQGWVGAPLEKLARWARGTFVEKELDASAVRKERAENPPKPRIWPKHDRRWPDTPSGFTQ